MKIALLGTRGIPPKYGGTETYVEKLSLYLASKGDEVFVYGEKTSESSAQSSDLGDHYPDNIKQIGVGCIPTKHLNNFSRTLLSTFHVCLNPGVQLVQFNNVGPAFFSFIPRLFGKKVVCAVRAIDSQRDKWNPLAKAFLRLCDLIAVKIPHATTVNAISMQGYYLGKYNAATTYIPNGIKIPETKLKPNYIEKWDLANKNYILFAARLEPEKGCHTIINAYKRLVSECDTPIKLAIAGHRGHSSDYYKDLMVNESDRILFLGYVSGDALDELYDNAFAFVLPSSVEGMSNSLLSAMAHGIPVVVSDIPENTALIESAPFNGKLNDKPGLSFRLGESDNLAEKLKILISDPNGACERGLLLRRHVSENFTLETMGQNTRRVYTDLLSDTA